MIDLRPDHLDTVQRILAEHVPECEVRAFGSRAAWTAKDYSDLDLAVVGAGPLDWRTLGRLKEAFEESSLPMRVDVLDWHAIPDSFRQVIEQGYVVVQEAGGEQTDGGRVAEVALWQTPAVNRNFGLTASEFKLLADGSPVWPSSITDIEPPDVDWNTVPHVRSWITHLHVPAPRWLDIETSQGLGLHAVG